MTSCEVFRGCARSTHGMPDDATSARCERLSQNLQIWGLSGLCLLGTLAFHISLYLSMFASLGQRVLDQSVRCTRSVGGRLVPKPLSCGSKLPGSHAVPALEILEAGWWSARWDILGF